MLIRRVLRIVDDTRDAEYGPDIVDNWAHENVTSRFGTVAGNTWESYLQFPIDLPAGTEITSATLELTAHTAQASSTVASVAALDLYTGTLVTDRHSVASVGSPVAWTIGEWTANLRSALTRIDITSLVQAVIDRSGYAAGDVLTLRLRADGQARRVFHSMGDGSTSSPMAGKTPTLGIVYDDGETPFASAADTLAIIRAAGREQITYVPSHGNSRSIYAIVERSPRQGVDGYDRTYAPGLIVHVANHPTDGISSAELDTSLDRIVVAKVCGKPAETRQISGVNYHDFGGIELELA
jgi:hypothetical protein